MVILLPGYRECQENLAGEEALLGVHVGVVQLKIRSPKDTSNSTLYVRVAKCPNGASRVLMWNFIGT